MVLHAFYCNLEVNWSSHRALQGVLRAHRHFESQVQACVQPLHCSWKAGCTSGCKLRITPHSWRHRSPQSGLNKFGAKLLPATVRDADESLSCCWDIWTCRKLVEAVFWRAQRHKRGRKQPCNRRGVWALWRGTTHTLSRRWRSSGPAIGDLPT